MFTYQQKILFIHNLYLIQVFIKSPDKLAGAFINPPKRFVQKRTKQKSYSTCKYI